METRRRMERKQLRHYLSVRDRESDRHVGFLGNVTAQGLLIYSKQPAEPEDRFELAVELPEPVEEGGEIALTGRVLWTMPDPDFGLHAIGLTIESIDPAELRRLAAVLDRLEAGP